MVKNIKRKSYEIIDNMAYVKFSFIQMRAMLIIMRGRVPVCKDKVRQRAIDANFKQEQIDELVRVCDGPRINFLVLEWARRNGKTELMNWIIQFISSLNGGHRELWYFAPTLGQAKDIFWRRHKEIMIDTGQAAKINNGDLEIEMKNGSISKLKGTKEYDRKRGNAMDLAAVDEAVQADPEIIDDVIIPALSDKYTDGLCVIIGTPMFDGDLLDVMHDMCNENEDWEFDRRDVYEGGNITPQMIERRKRDMPPEKFAREFLCQRPKGVGAVYYAFEYDRAEPNCHIEEFEIKKKTGLELIVGMDFNVNPMCAVIGIMSEGQLLIFDYIYQSNSDTIHMVKELKHRYVTKQDEYLPNGEPNPAYYPYSGCHLIVHPDASGKNRSANSQDTNFTLLENDFELAALRKNPLTEHSIQTMNQAFLTNKIKIHPSCTRLIYDLKMFRYKEGSTGVPEKGEHDHMTDALKYPVWNLFPIPDLTRQILKDKFDDGVNLSNLII